MFIINCHRSCNLATSKWQLFFWKKGLVRHYRPLSLHFFPLHKPCGCGVGKQYMSICSFLLHSFSKQFNIGKLGLFLNKNTWLLTCFYTIFSPFSGLIGWLKAWKHFWGIQPTKYWNWFVLHETHHQSSTKNYNSKHGCLTKVFQPYCFNCKRN